MKNKFTKSLIISLGLHLAFFGGLGLFIHNNSDKPDTSINVEIFQFSQPKVRPRKNILKAVRPVLVHEKTDLLDHHNFAPEAHTLPQIPIATTIVTKSGDEAHELIQSRYEIHDTLVIPPNRIIRVIPVRPYKIELNYSKPSQIPQEVAPRTNIPHRLPGLHSILTSITLTESRIEPWHEFLDVIRRKIEKVKTYPHWAREAGYEGVTKIQFAILSNGKLGKVSVIDSSGYGILDKAAVAAIKKASPFPPLPESLNRDILQVELPIVFRLSMKN